jgi:hypothetical protein
MSLSRVRFSFLILALWVCGSAHAQMLISEFVQKGGKQMTKADLQEMMPIRHKSKWPNRQGEEDLVLSVDGKISGTGYHYASRTQSAAEGTWKLEEDGKMCTPKKWLQWGSSANLCWYIFKSGDDYYGAQKNDPESKILGKIDSFTKDASPAAN